MLLGITWAVAHTQLQSWMTDAVARDRPVGTALFATALFAGAATGAAIGSAIATGDAYHWFFIGATVAGVVFTLGALDRPLPLPRSGRNSSPSGRLHTICNIFAA